MLQSNGTLYTWRCVPHYTMITAPFTVNLNTTYESVKSCYVAMVTVGIIQSSLLSSTDQSLPRGCYTHYLRKYTLVTKNVYFYNLSYVLSYAGNELCVIVLSNNRLDVDRCMPVFSSLLSNIYFFQIASTYWSSTQNRTSLFLLFVT